ncbi:Extracellular serine/threonine protein kinase four-jointed [Orchesella cincta]|uniref:Extracellular serine/threonine protein kinase four-jointed n=1 Tax=Orchesella cincta TaxID=48709 RepID=A0A1D2NG21_ORCCI|nr:Extracellular serine/threonine protein kinase four-jointed [Orchesella cincta]
MEANCECEPNSVIPKCTCDQVRCDNTFNSQYSKNCCRSSASYWAHASTRDTCRSSNNNSKLPASSTDPSISTISNCSRAYSANSKEMAASWRYPVSTCFSPCISVRRLHRPYAEQRMRCFLTTVIAFCLGISVGALLPFFFPPADMFPLSPSQSSGGVPKSISEAMLSFPPPPHKESLVAQLSVEVPSNRAMQPVIEIQSASPPISKVTFVDNSLNQVAVKRETSSSKVLPAVDGIFWSDWVERILPRGFSDEDVSSWRSLVANSSVSNVEAGCGRMQNRLVTYENGKKACCRYRQNFDQIQGEIFSFYLSQLLQIRNLAPSTMDAIDSKNDKWSGVQDQIKESQWVDEKPVVLTQFVDNLAPAFIPEQLRSSTRRVHPPDVSSVVLPEATETQLNSSNNQAIDNIRELAQWSDLIVFDYLTANLDRMVNNLYNLQWNPSMMDAPAHNLAKDISSGLLVFLDNESGLLHGYRLLDKYEHYHRLMLDSLCIFRKSTAEAISRLHAYGSIQPLFKSILSQFAGSQMLPMIPDKSIKVLNQRINTVHRQIQKCQSLYATSDQIPSDKVDNNSL